MVVANMKHLKEIDFAETELDTLPRELEEARVAGQHVFIWDKTGVVPLYFDGKAVDFTEQMV